MHELIKGGSLVCTGGSQKRIDGSHSAKYSHIRLNEPERIQKRQDAADSLRAAVITAYEKEVVENG